MFDMDKYPTCVGKNCHMSGLVPALPVEEIAGNWRQISNCNSTVYQVQNVSSFLTLFYWNINISLDRYPYETSWPSWPHKPQWPQWPHGSNGLIYLIVIDGICSIRSPGGKLKLLMVPGPMIFSMAI